MKITIRIVLFLLIAFLFFYFGLPVLNFGFFQLPILVFLLVVLATLFSMKFQAYDNGQKVKLLKYPPKFLWISILVVLAYMVLGPLFTSMPMFRAESYRELIGNVKTGEKISNHIAPISIDEIRVVDEPLAHLLGEKILGSQPALGSQVEIGDFTIQKVKHELYWVAPLLHTGFFKWMNNSEGTPGYVMVSATNERDVRLVENVNGKPVKIKYQPEAFFGSKIERHVYFNGYMTVGLEDFNFEIDDSGHPYWVVTTFKKRIGFSGNDATGVLVVDSETGAIQEFGIENAPEWVDRVQPISFIKDQLGDWGDYVHGFWNWSNRDKLMITEDLTLVYGHNNRSYWYTGISSVGKEESAVGFVLVDTRTKEATVYGQSGATEYAAQSSAEGKVQEKGYHASLPIPYNINNIPTYVMTLKDEGGLVKMYAMVSINDYTIVGVGNSMRETLSAYKSVYNMTGTEISPDSASNKNVLKTIVSRIQSDVKNGTSFYYFTVKDHKKIFIATSQVSAQLPITVAGDSVKISFDVDQEAVIDVSTFENSNLAKK